MGASKHSVILPGSMSRSLACWDLEPLLRGLGHARFTKNIPKKHRYQEELGNFSSDSKLCCEDLSVHLGRECREDGERRLF